VFLTWRWEWSKPEGKLCGRYRTAVVVQFGKNTITKTNPFPAEGFRGL